MNLQQIYRRAVNNLSSSPSPELDANVLIQHVLAKDAAFVISNPETPLTNAQYAKLRRLIDRRKKGEPIAYLTGRKEFYGYFFFVNKNVLTPRPESEWLVEQAIEFIKSKVHKVESEFKIKNLKLNILDMGTGSGCLIVSIAKELYELDGLSDLIDLYASDISEKALRVAKKNTKRLLFERKRELKNVSSSRLIASNNIKFVHSDLFKNRLLHKKFDLILANLPYVPKKVESRKLKVESIDFEPSNAIFANDHGTSIIKRFLDDARDRLTQSGAILVELDPRNTEQIKSFARKLYPNAQIELEKDLANLSRYLMINNIN